MSIVRKANLLGLTIGDLTVIEEAPSVKGRAYWKCNCSCGNTVVKVALSLTRKKNAKHHCGCKDKTLLNKTFGYLTPLEKGLTLSGRYGWLCKCICGNLKVITAQNLETGKTISCGCMNPNRTINLVGNSFGKLLVISQVTTETTKSKKWNCLCECGESIIVTSTDLLRGKNSRTHCGCSGIKKSNNKLIGKMFGSLTVSNETRSKRGKKAWECVCGCGNKIILETSALLTGTTVTCPDCSSFKTERIAIQITEKLTGLAFPKTRFCFNGNRYEFDGYNEKCKIAIEYQGYQHYIFPNFFQKTLEEHEKAKQRDNNKRQYCLLNNIQLIEIPYTEENNLETFIQQKLAAITGLVL